MSVPELSQPIQIKPIINYPREAQTGQTYLMSIDVQLASPDASWPYPDEEYPITFILNTQPYFRYEPLNGEREPGIVLHRFGGTYGPAQYLLTASEQEVKPGHISITFLNGWGLPMVYLELECSVKAELATNKEQEITVLSEKNVPTTSKASPIVEGEKPPDEEIKNTEAVSEEMAGFDLIWEQLEQIGWTLLYFSDADLESYQNVVLTNLFNFPNDYFLFINQRLVGIIRDRAAGELLTDIEETILSEALIKEIERWLNISIRRTGYPVLPFVYETTGVETRFTNYLEPEPRRRRVFTFHRPETLARWLEQAPPNIPASQNNLLRSRLQRMPTLQRKGLREHQFEAISNLERSLAQNHRHALIQMETGTGVTFTGLNIIYRLLEYGGARRILYALDTSTAKDYVIDILQTFVPSNATVKFINLYDTDYMRGKWPDPSASVCIATSEQFSSIFVAEYPVAGYNPTVPIEYFDAIIINDCSSAVYESWEPLIDYFDAFIVGITEDADEQLVSLYGDNLVYEQATKLSQTVTYRDNALILTSLPIEYEAVHRHLSRLLKETDESFVYERGEFADKQWHWDVGIMQIEADRPGAVYEAQKAINYFDPSIILFVGIASGLNDARPGDVVVADTVARFELNTARKEQLPLLPKISSSSEQLLQKARIESHMHNWRRRIRYNEQEQTLENIAPRVLVGQLVAVSTAGAALRFSRRLPEDAVAMEMGSSDLFYAADLGPDTEILIIRGISDRTDSQKAIEAADPHERAAHHASAFAFEMLAKLGIDGAAKLEIEKQSDEKEKELIAQPGVVVDVSLRQVWLDGQLLQHNLPPLEFKLLAHLARHSGTVCKREDLVRTLYSEDHYDRSDQRIYAVLSRLREALKEDSLSPRYLITHRGGGIQLTQGMVINDEGI